MANNPENPKAKPAPQQVAVAIKQSGSAESLPKIAASGRGLLAEQILELAFEHGVKVREDADLAEILATLDIDSDIPSEAIVAVAEILTRVYEANAAMAARDNVRPLEQTPDSDSPGRNDP
ncbi:MAG: flagellar protein FhlB [Alphaproteobacteria bacterium]|nr:flagellar protein FhlB [Alphaproteobacteria bacterium]